MRRALVILAIACIAGCNKPADKSGPTSGVDSGPATGSVRLTLRFDGTAFEVTDSARSERTELVGVIPLETEVKGGPAGSLDLLDETRVRLRSFGVDRVKSGYDFFDMPDPDDPDLLRGGIRPLGIELHVVSIPLMDGAEYLAVGAGSPLSVADIPPLECPPCVREPVLLHPAEPQDTSRMFDIVILGDGFQESEQDVLLEYAERLTNGLLGMEPFSEHASMIQVHLIPAVSQDSGVDHYPKRGWLKDTCFNLEGYWDGATYVGYCGTPTPETVWSAIGCHFLPTEIDLRIMLFNADLYAGRGDPVAGMAYAATWNSDRFVDLVAHEIGHALAGLGEEYQGAEPWLGEKPSFPNVTTRQHYEEYNVGWFHLAEDRDKDAEGNLRILSEYQGDRTDACQTDPFRQAGRVPHRLQHTVGLFWGAQFVDEVPDAQCWGNFYGDPRGADYFRPQARCKMRYLSADLCRVCRSALEEEILKVIERPR